MTYRQAADFLFHRQQHGVKFGLETIRSLLDRIGNPEREFACVHIAGTNGKGSTAALLELILRRSGYRTGLYTSPHLIDMRERIQVAGRRIGRAEVVGLLERVKSGIEAAGASYFEALTALAFDYFARQKVSIAVIETGLGGRLDATNVVDPVLTVITEIGRDHMNFLGNTLESISAEKAGILKSGVPCIAGTKRKKVRGFLELAAAAKPCPILFSWKSVRIRGLRCTDEGSWFDAESGGSRYGNLYLKLLGSHQIDNARTVLAAVDALRKRGIAIPEKAVREGFAKVVWRARLEVLRRDPLVLLDSGHNPAGIRTLARAIRTLFRFDRFILVFGVLADKDYRRMLEAVAPLADKIILTRPRSERAADPESLARLRCLEGKDVSVIPEIPGAWTAALRSARKNDLVCGTGSMYFVGEVLKLEEGKAQPNAIRVRPASTSSH
jgi:dihydrofolate synthase/folylpolyglutamate synthase